MVIKLYLVLLGAVLILHQYIFHTNFYFLQGEEVDTTQTSISNASEPGRESKDISSLCIIAYNPQTYRKWTPEKMLIVKSPHWLVPSQAMLDFHQQVGSVVAHISEQYKELFGKEDRLSKICSQEQMKAQLTQALIASGRYFTFKEQMEVSRTMTSITEGTLKPLHNHFVVFCSCRWRRSKICPSVLQSAVVRIIRDVMQRREAFTDPQEMRAFINKLYICLVDQTHVALNKVNTHTHAPIPVYTLTGCIFFHPLCFCRSIQMTLKMTLWMRSN